MDEADEQAISEIVEKYGCQSESQAVRMAVRALAQHPKIALTPPTRPKHARKSPKIENK